MRRSALWGTLILSAAAAFAPVADAQQPTSPLDLVYRLLGFPAHPPMSWHYAPPPPPIAAPSNSSPDPDDPPRQLTYTSKPRALPKAAGAKAAVASDDGALVPVEGGLAGPCAASTSAAFEATGRFLYVTQGAGVEGVCGYRIDPANGRLTLIAGSPFPTGAGSGPEAIAADPTGAFVFVANQTKNSIAAFVVNEASGALTPVPGSPFAAGSFPRALAVDASGRFLYAANNTPAGGDGSISGYAIDRATGALTPLAGSPFAAADRPWDIDTDPRGRYVYVAGGNLQAYAIDQATGALSKIGAPIPASPTGVAVEPSGRFVYASSDSGMQAYAIAANGTLSPIGGAVAAGANPLYPAVSFDGRYVYVANLLSGDISGYRIDQSTGALTPIAGSPYPAAPSVFSIAAGGAMPAADYADVGHPYSHRIAAYGGLAPYKRTIVGGALPPGIALDPDTGMLSGTPTAMGTYDFTVQATDRGGHSATTAYTLVVSPNGLAPGSGNYQGLWWKSPAGDEAGWGINFAHQGDTIFATWFTYDALGQPLWLAAVLDRSAPGVYSGPVFTTTGPYFAATPWDGAAVVETVVGAASVTFGGDDDASFAYTVGGVTQEKPLTRQVFADGVPSCTWGGAPDLALAINYQDLWWKHPAGSEPGWGVNFTHQDEIIFATWFTYGADGKPRWLIAVAQRQSGNVFAGPISTVTGPPLGAVPWDPALVAETEVGSTTITFVDGNRATFAYTLEGLTQTREITRQVFAPPGTVCR